MNNSTVEVLLLQALLDARPAQEALEAGRDAQELGLLQGAQEGLLSVLAGAGQDLDRRLEGADALLGLALLALVSLGLLLAHLGGLAGGLDVRSDVLLELLDLNLVRGDLALELDDQGLSLLDRLLGLADLGGLLAERVLAPARELVVRGLLRLAVGLDL